MADPPEVPPRPPRWRVRLLGDLQAMDARGTVLTRWPSRAVALLLARLALAPQRAHPREELVDLLWPEASLEVGRNRLRQVLSTLKSLLEPAEDTAAGPVIVADRTAVRLAPQSITCDVVQFEACVRARQREQALALYRGPLLPGHFDEWVLDERQRLEALAERMDFGALPVAAPLANDNPSLTHLTTARVSPVGAPGAAAVARVGVAATAATSAPAPAPPPAPASASASAATAAALSSAATADASRGASLPSYLTRLHGAQEVQAALLQAVQHQRLVSLVGPGGAGKTRLAVEVAWACAATQPPRFDLIGFVSLVGATSAEGVLEALGSSLRTEAQREALCVSLAGRQALLVLDNCEQVIAAAAQEVAALLDRLPLLHVLATSRRGLGLDGEHVLPLPTLATPDPREALAALALNPAVALFVDRARLARSDFHLTAANAAAVAGLVCWLDGMPLAIELAAARVRSLGPAQMLQLMQQGEPGAPSPLALVARSGPRGNADARHASMVEVVAWSWRMLSDGARALLAAMALFPGGFTLEAAHAVAGISFITLGTTSADALDSPLDDLSEGAPSGPSGGSAWPVGTASHGQQSLATTAQQIDELVEHSMLRPALDGERFAPYEVIREYALSQLSTARAAAVRTAQRRWLLEWARSLPTTPPLAQVRAEMPNIVAVLAACSAPAAAAPTGGSADTDTDTDTDTSEGAGAGAGAGGGSSTAPGAGTAGAADDAIDLLALLRRCFEDVDLPAAGLRHLEAAIEICADPARASRGRSLIAGLLFSAGRADAALQQARLGLAGAAALDPAARARALHAMASVHWRAKKDAAGALPLIGEAEPLAQAAGALDVQASLCALRAFIVSHVHRNMALAQQLHQRALDLWLAQGNQHAVDSGLYNLAVVASRVGGAPGAQRALDLLDQVLTSARRHGDSHRERQALNVQGNALMAQKRWREAAQVLRECVQQSWRAMAAHDLAYGLWNLPRPLLHLRQAEQALRLMAFAGAYWRGHFGALSAQDLHDQRLIRRLASLSLAPARAEALWREGEQLTLAEAVAQALDH